MKTYTVTFAQDVAHYATVCIQADDDRDAREKARALWNDDESPFTDDPDWNNTTCQRIVEITDTDGNCIAADISLDECHIRCGGDEERRLCDAAPEMLAVLEAAGKFSWVHNVAVTNDIDMLRTICLEYAEWWNRLACPVIARARDIA